MTRHRPMIVRALVAAAALGIALAGCGGPDAPAAGEGEPATGAPPPTTAGPAPAEVPDDRDWCATVPRADEVNTILGVDVQEPVETLRLELGRPELGNEGGYSVRCYYVVQGESLDDHPLRGESGILPGDVSVEVAVGVDDWIWDAQLQGRELLPSVIDSPQPPADLGDEAVFTTMADIGVEVQSILLDVRQGSYAITIHALSSYEQLAELARVVLGVL